MKSSRHLPPERAIFAPPNQTTGSCMDIPGAAYGFGIASNPVGPEQSSPFHGIEFQPSKLCPRNFIIFDQTDFQSRVMFNPAIAPKFAPAAVQTCPTYVNADRAVSSPNQEDSDEINALLSLDDDDDDDDDDDHDDDDDDGDCEEYDDEDEMSTARTNGNYGCGSPDSCSNYGEPKLNPKFSVSSLLPKPYGIGSSNCSSGTKNQKMKKMVKALRGIVPGGAKMSTVTLLDEAVKYLKSLKVEAQKIGGDMKN